MNKIADYKSLYSQRLNYKSSRTVLSILVLLCCNIIAALTSCSNDPVTAIDYTPDGFGRLTITISTPEAIQTRAVDTTTPWLEGTAAERAIYSYHLLVCNGSTILQTISGSTLELGNHEADPKNYYPSTETITIDLLPTGTYDLTFYCLANFTTEMMTATGLTMSNGQVTSTTLPTNFETKVMQPIANGIAAVPATGLPMTGKLTQNNVSIGSGTTISDPLILWRMMAKLEFLFTNGSNSNVKVKGIEVEPINQATAANSSGVYLISQDNLTSTANLAAGTSGITLPANASTDIGCVTYEPSTALELAAKNDGNTDEGKLFFYVNETDATFTTTENQLSLRFKIQRYNSSTSTWYTEELRYGMTTHYGDGSIGQNGFNVIRRNDWIHIPIVLGDWIFRIEPLAFVPIAGYPATTLSSDALTATFSTGGMIVLKPFAQKNNDGSWRDFSDPEVTFVSLSWKNSDGTNVVDNGTDPKEIVKTAFTYDSSNHCIIGELNNSLSPGTYKTTLVVNVKLGPSGSQYDYSFTCNVVLKIPTSPTP